MKLPTNNKILLVFAFAIFTTISAFAQTAAFSVTDSLSLTEILKQVVATHPTVQEASEALNDADAKTGLARSAYNPNIDFLSSYTRIGPVSEMTLPGMGTFKLFPENNYNAEVKVNQTIYDFGKTSKSVAYEKESKNLSIQNVELAKQKLATTVIANYYAILYLQKAQTIKMEQLATLNEHLAFVQKKKDTGSGTNYEILSTQVKVSTTESQLSDIETALQVQTSVLNSLLGIPQSSAPKIKIDLAVTAITLPLDTLLTQAFAQRDEMILAQETNHINELKYDATKKLNAPSIGAFASGGIKNGYIPDMEKLTPNYMVGLSLRIPLFDSGREKYHLAHIKTTTNANNYETESLRRKITNEVVENKAKTELAYKKISQFNLQLQQAQHALQLAQTSFQNGVITNLDLLDATTTVSESQLLLLNAKIEYALFSYKLKFALGERLY